MKAVQFRYNLSILCFTVISLIYSMHIHSYDSISSYDPAAELIPSSVNSDYALTFDNYLGNWENIHPKVLYFEEGWRGYNFWMAYTPYPEGNVITENPCIAASYDGIVWETPKGLTNPLAMPLADGYNSDTHLLYDDINDRLECWWRIYEESTKRDKLVRRISSDGINWTEQETVLPFWEPEAGRLSPAVWIEDGCYRMVYSNGIKLRYMSAPVDCDYAAEPSIPEIQDFSMMPDMSVDSESADDSDNSDNPENPENPNNSENSEIPPIIIDPSLFPDFSVDSDDDEPESSIPPIIIDPDFFPDIAVDPGPDEKFCLLDWSPSYLLPVDWGDLHAWHHDVIVDEDGDWDIVICAFHDGQKTNENDLYYVKAKSDLSSATEPVEILHRSEFESDFDSQSMYRPSLVRVDSEFFLYYSAISKGQKRCIALLRGPSIFELRSLTPHEMGFKLDLTDE